MGLFRKKQSSQQYASIVPGAALARLSEVGRAAFAAVPTHLDVSDFYLEGFIAAGSPIEEPGLSSFVTQFVDELNRGSSGGDGWSVAGAFFVAKDFVGSDKWTTPELVDLLDRALRFLAAEDVGSGSIPMFALARWSQIQAET